MSEQILTFEQWQNILQPGLRQRCLGHRCYTLLEPHWMYCPVCGMGVKPQKCLHTYWRQHEPVPNPCDPVIVVEDKPEYNRWERCYVKCQVCGASTKGRLRIASAINVWNCCGIFDMGKDTYEE